ncbi:lysozyme [Prauserella marina]|uniref:Glycosyl hydrolases family 25 n=1 Tax=Prauserella marina TaxID=530584 RepID=A0A222VVY0_9PSEU|nr:GH25 family lysozyme [Prauserella marina]ASR38065.1 lysozyme [Prauserella marina]PWV73309.1 glycosyl hydrolase family 25 [Prauserella marina]SDD66711.1 Glycosyl hydrolases family 25 [Prauserella marina]
MREQGAERGINLSLHETVDDWGEIKASSVSFASITVTESMNWTDDAAARQVTDAFRAGVHAGIRHYARPGGVQDQAKHLVRAGMPLGAFAPGALAPALDVGASGVDDRFIKSWIKTMRNASGIRRVLVYASYDDWLHRFRPDKWADEEVVLWLVRPNGIPGRPGWFHARLGLHQHTNVDRAGTDALVYPFTLSDVLL